MFDQLTSKPADKILALMAMLREDPREDKLDLGVGVYRDENGLTPIMAAVRDAERTLLETQETKSYLGMDGNADYNKSMSHLIFGDQADFSRIRACQAPGGSGALHILAILLSAAHAGATVWQPEPTWPNHAALLHVDGLAFKNYPYLDPANGTLVFDAMIDALGGAKAGDVVLLHGCCHNPSGVDLNLEQWHALADLFDHRGLVPFVDIAYQGFGDGIDEDAAGLRILAHRLPEMVVAASSSKNFAVYRDRVGSALILADSSGNADTAFSHLTAAARSTYSMPPDHGAAAVAMVLNDPGLRSNWKDELDGIRQRIEMLRGLLAQALRQRTQSDRFDYLTRCKGMFSKLNLQLDCIRRLRNDHGVYIIDDGRINVAALTEASIDKVALSVSAVLR